MAAFNEILTGALSAILAKRLGMQTGTPAPTLAPEIMPVISLEADRPEWKALAREVMMVGGGSVAGVAGQRSKLRLQNPVGSNALVVVELITVASITSGFVNIKRIVGIAPGGTPTLTVPTDSRIPGGALNAAFNSAATLNIVNEVGALPNSYNAWRMSAPANLNVTVPWVITPGNGVELEAQTDNTTLIANLFWRERALVQGELV